MPETKEKKSPITLIIISIILLIGSISNLVICMEYYNYNKKTHPHIQGCLDVDKKEEYDTMDKIKIKKEERDAQQNIDRGKPQYGNSEISSNITISIILLLVGILFMVSAILSYQGKDFADFLYKGKSQKYIFMILGIFLIAAGITYGILVAKYKSDKYLKNAVRAVCFTLDDIKSVEDIDKYFDRRVDHDDPQPTITMQITTAFAIIYSFAGLILMAMGGSKGRRKYRRANQPIIIQMQAPAPAPSVEDETKSFVLAH
tara:strand:+ start:867 stop:1643 length:777 start_codon:yes stop_codon:yes gene_type:complete